MNIGDLVEYNENAIACGEILASGNDFYTDAVVVSLEPLVLVSWFGDMLWNNENPENFQTKRVTPIEVFTRCMLRYKKDKERQV